MKLPWLELLQPPSTRRCARGKEADSWALEDKLLTWLSHCCVGSQLGRGQQGVTLQKGRVMGRLALLPPLTACVLGHSAVLEGLADVPTSSHKCLLLFPSPWHCFSPYPIQGRIHITGKGLPLASTWVPSTAMEVAQGPWCVCWIRKYLHS